MNQQWASIPEAIRTPNILFNTTICGVAAIEAGPPTHYFTRPRALLLRYAAMSFPNNTVGNAFVAGVFLTLYLNARLKPFGLANKQPNPFKALVVTIPLIVALGLSSVPVGVNECSGATARYSALIAFPCAYLGYMGSFQSAFDSKTNHMPKIYSLYPWLEQPQVQLPVGRYQNGWYRWRAADRTDRTE
ncbi:MAG: hypothetical protein Q9178_005962 [Gyalolechia marmorata]